MDGIGKSIDFERITCDRFADLYFRDYGTTRGFANESEYTVVKVDFYNDIKRYLSELSNTQIRSLEDIVKYVYLF